MALTETRSEKSNRQKCNLYTKQSLYRDTNTISTITSNDGVKTNARSVRTTPVVIRKNSKCEDSEAKKSLKNIVGSDDDLLVARLGRVLLKLYSHK